MKNFIATIRFQSNDEPTDDLDNFIDSVIPEIKAGIITVTDFNIEEELEDNAMSLSETDGETEAERNR